MQIIHKKNYISIVCIVFTCLSMNKVLLEYFSGVRDEDYIQNFICMLVLTAAAVFVLGLHYYLQEIPVVLVIILQYLLLLGIAMGYVWLSSFFEPLHEDAYRDIFRSLTIPYVLFVPVYYIDFFIRVKKANQILSEIKENQIEDGDNQS